MAEGKHGKRDLEYRSHPARSVIVKVGQTVEKGEFLTDGSANLEELYQYAGKEATQVYIIEEITRIYELQGVAISRKHLELIVRQMFSRVELVTAGDTQFSVGDVVVEFELDVANDEVKTKGGEAGKGKRLVLGIAEVSLTRASFLAAVSFQHATRKLTDAAVSGVTDNLVGLKENVIIGRLIPAGTGFPGSRKKQMITDLQRELDIKFPHKEVRRRDA
jgi:DNA-directed RNA polymerase subunit beta'